jgi:outer membrane protein assembly factor BamB
MPVQPGKSKTNHENGEKMGNSANPISRMGRPDDTGRAGSGSVAGFKTGGSVYATPVIRDGVCYIGSLDSVFYAIDARTGAELWHFRTPGQIFSTAAVEGDLVCFESGNALIGLDLQGNLKWQTQICSYPVVNRRDDWDDFHSSPVVVDTVAYVGSERGRVVGVGIRSGAVVFECTTKGHSPVETPPAVYGGRIYFGDWDGVLHVYDLATGQLAWEYDTRNDNVYGWVNAMFNQPLFWNGSLYFAGRSCNLYCLDPETGAKKWMYHDPGSMWLLGGPVISDGILYTGARTVLLRSIRSPAV